VSGETEQAVKGLAEPVLVLSFPATATAFDDGLLTSNEVAQLKLNAGGTGARGGRPVHADAKVRHRPDRCSLAYARLPARASPAAGMPVAS
jgi:hypothetical protein